MKLKEVEAEFIKATLTQVAGNRTKAAASLGIGIRTLQRKILRYELDFPTSEMIRNGKTRTVRAGKVI